MNRIVPTVASRSLGSYNEDLLYLLHRLRRSRATTRSTEAAHAPRLYHVRNHESSIYILKWLRSSVLRSSSFVRRASSFGLGQAMGLVMPTSGIKPTTSYRPAPMSSGRVHGSEHTHESLQRIAPRRDGCQTPLYMYHATTAYKEF